MTLFFIGYLIAIASTITFIVAILTPKWIYPNNLPVDVNHPSSPKETNYRGIFYVDAGFPNETCRDWILIYKNSVASCRPPYAVACAALAIIGSSLSIILLWLGAGYLYVRRRRLAPSFICGIAFLTLLIFWISAIIWIVMLTMNRDVNLKLRRENIGFSTWIAVGATGGYLIAFILFTLQCLHYNKKNSLPIQTNINLQRF